MEDKREEKEFSLIYIDILCRIVFAIILYNLILTAFSNTLIHQLRAPVLKSPYVDPTYWVMHLLHLPELISSNIYLAWLLDILLFATCIGALIFPRQKWIIGLYIAFYFVYTIIFNSYGIDHTHPQIVFLITPVPFLFSQKAFSYTWEGLRYFFLFSYSAAFLWKFLRFSWLQSDQGVLIMKRNLAPYLYYNPDTFLANVYVWFLNNPFWVNAIFIIGFIAEGAFIIGFFTKKYDKYLFFLSLALLLGFWFLADAVFYGQVIYSLTLLHLKSGSKYFKGAKSGINLSV